MNLNIGVNSSPDNKLDKSFTVALSLTGTMREESSVIDPVITVATGSSITGCNYAYIEEFGRYYFIRNISSIRNGVWELQLHVDVLSTYKAAIRTQTAVVKRQERNYNLYLDDGIFKTYQNPFIVTKAFPSGFHNASFILAVAGGD